MLEGLNNIQWERLHHAYGSAEDVPVLIEALTHPDDDIRDKTLYALYGTIWHQGTVYQATAYAVPFLIELLGDPDITRKYDILIYLAHLAQGTSYHQVHQAIGDPTSIDYQVQLDEELGYVRQTHYAVRDGLEVYFRLLFDKDEDLHTRMAVPYLLACFPEHQAMIAPRLHRLLPYEPHRLMRASIVQALRYIQPNPEQLTWLAPYLAPDEDLIVRLCSAMTIAHLATDKTPMTVILLLIDILKNSSAIDEEYEQLTWSEGDIVGDVCKALMHVGYDKLESVIPNMTEALRRVDFYSSNNCVDALLYIVFDGNPLSDDITANDLTLHQRLVLYAILESPNTWRITLNDGKTMLNGNISSMMQAYNLPTHPDEMREFLQL